MKLSPKAFNRFLNYIGQDFGWRRSYACPCVNRNSGAANPSCPFCQGKGRQWGDVVLGKAGIVSRDQMRDFSQLGVWDQGDIMLSIPSDSPLYDVGVFDRILAINRSEPFSINMIRGLNDTIKFPVISVERVFWVDKNVIRDVPLPTVNPDGTLTWSSGSPPNGVTYSVTGRRTPEYYVYTELPVDRPMHFGEPLPRRVVLRRFDLFGL